MINRKIVSSYKATNGTTYTLLAHDNSRLFSPDEIKALEIHNAVYCEIVREDIAKTQAKKDEAVFKASLPLSDEAYLAIRKKEEAAKQAKIKILAAEDKQFQKAKLAELASTPATFDIFESTIPAFLLSLQGWLKKGYSIDENTIECWMNFNAVKVVRNV